MKSVEELADESFREKLREGILSLYEHATEVNWELEVVLKNQNELICRVGYNLSKTYDDPNEEDKYQRVNLLNAYDCDDWFSGAEDAIKDNFSEEEIQAEGFENLLQECIKADVNAAELDMIDYVEQNLELLLAETRNKE